MLLLSDSDLSNILLNLSHHQCQRLLCSLEGILKSYSMEKCSQEPRDLQQPHRISLVNKHNDTTLVMPSSDTTNTAVKIVTLPCDGVATGAILVMKASGRVAGVLGATEVTAFRTALAVMSLFVHVNHIPKKNIVCFGSGRQVEWHIRLALLLASTQIENITIINRGRPRLDQLEKDAIASLRNHYPEVNFQLIAKADAIDYDSVLQTHLGSADVIFCCTPSTAPLFPFSFLSSSPKSRFISAIGSYKPHMKEIDEETLFSGGGKIFVDSKEACLDESGELTTANVTSEQLTEIGEILALDDKSRVFPTGNIVFKCVGMGIMDLAISRTLLGIAKELGRGVLAEGFYN